MNKDITEFNTLNQEEQKQYYEILWCWIQSHDLTFDLYKFLKQEEADSVIDVSKFFADYKEYINDEANDFEAFYNNEPEEHRKYKQALDRLECSKDNVMQIVNKVGNIYRFKTKNEDTEMIKALLQLICGLIGKPYPKDRSNVVYLQKLLH
ncbi:hypothetical protein [Paenibacillus vini]|uniref:Uncharacterized protein n=1 Tax=Paenibacillus vini TaxID=1476024 RepID=A0ABQ4M883_9BACL|nr:hypothetical protein [Paenibacillus vini]GIP52199.1 hypothetical protein J42TS3_12340 [Paenibacillus vini]